MPDAIEALEADFALFSDWEERYAHILALGRALAPLAAAEMREENRVRGCASQVWLVSEPAPGDPAALRFRADSDAFLVKGLIAVMLRVFADRRPEEILSVQPEALLKRLGLNEALTPQRSNGLRALIARMRAAAQAALGP